MLYKNKNSLTGEFIETNIPNLDIPENIDRPRIGAVERTMHIELTRAVGWHYNKNSMLFIPAYSESNGIKTPFEINLISTKGFVVKFKSQLFVNSIPLGLFLRICFPEVTRDLALSLINVDSKYMSSKYFRVPSGGLSNYVNSIINPRTNLDFSLALERFKYLFTKQTYISKNIRLKKFLSLSYFVGCYLSNDTVVYDGMVYHNIPLTDRDIFRLEHSGLLDISLVTSTGISFNVVLLSCLTIDLRSVGRSLSNSEMKYVEDCESSLDNVYIDENNLGSIDIPKYNTLPIYCIIINRLVLFNLLHIEIDMNSYSNQTLSTLTDVIDIYNKTDSALIDDKILSSNMLTGVSAVKFDTKRVERYIAKENSSLIVLTNNENPISLLASSGNTKVTKPVSHLSRDAIKIQEGTFGILDGTDVSENPNIGKSIPLVVTSFVNNQKLFTHLYIVENRCITDTVIEVESTGLEKYVICEYNANLNDEYVLAKVNGLSEYVKSEYVTHARVSPFSSTSICRAFALNLNISDLKRSQMSGKAIEQARTILLPERALVETGIESVALHLNLSLKLQVTVKQIIEEYVKQENLMNVSTLEEYNYQLDLIEQSPVYNVYRIGAIENSSIFGLFTLENKKTLKGSCTFNKLLPPKGGNYYKYDEYIYCDHTINESSSPVETSSALKFHTKGDLDYHKYGIGCGLNAKVMFGFYNSMTVDDASVVSDKFIRNMSMDTPVIFNVTYTISTHSSDNKEEFGFKDGDIKEGYDTYGLPKVGKLIYPNDILIYKYSINPLTNSVVPNNFKMPYDKCGEVLKVHSSKTEIVITFYNVVHLTVGDKSGGRHGNKLTIAKIIPYEQMFYDKETGEPVDMVLNPLSLCSRMNLGQLPELYISAKQVKENKGTKIEPLFEPVFEKYIKENVDAQDITMRTMIDGETGLELPNPMFVGYMYILRSVHITEDKVRAVGDSLELDPAFLQPVGRGSKNQRGQSVDSMVTDLLTSSGCYNLINEIKGIMSSDVSYYNQIIKSIEDNGYNPDNIESGDNIQISHLKIATLCLYVNLVQNGDMFHIKFASDEVIKSYKELNLQNIQSDLIDNKMCKDISYIPFNCSIISPIALEKMNCLNSITVLKYSGDKYVVSNLSSDLALDIINEMSYVVLRYFEDFDLEVFFVSKIQEENSKTGMNMLLEIVSYYNSDKALALLEKRMEISLANSNKFSPRLEELIRTAKSISDSGGYSQFISTVLPVIPLKYRVSSKSSKLPHDLTRGYLYVASLCSMNDRSNSHYRMLYEGCKKLLLSTNSEYKSIFEFLFKKELDGRVRNFMLKTRVKHSMRANIAPSEMGHPDYVGIPLIGALFMYQPLINNMVQDKFKWVKEYATTHIEVSEYLASLYSVPLTQVRKMTGGHIRDRWELNYLTSAIESVCNNQLSYYYRPPALHETSVRGGYVYITPDKVARISTLITAEQNADFDGDQEPFNAVFGHKAINDVKQHLLPSSKLRRSNDGEVSLRINQDSLLGLYLMTLPNDNDNVKVFSSINQIHNHIELGLTNPNQLCMLASKGKIIKSTIGRILVSHIIDNLRSLTLIEGDTFYTPCINKIITGNVNNEYKISIASILLEITKRNNNEVSTIIITQLQEIGYLVNHNINTTLSLNDFKLILSLENPKDKFLDKFLTYKGLEDYGLLPDNWSSSLESDFLKYKKELRIKERLGSFNALYKMVDSGAKGNESQLEKMFGLIGFVKGSKGLLDTPILTNYIRGVSQFSTEDLSFEQRENAISTVHDTSDPGVALRTGCIELGGLIVKNKTSDFNPEYPHRIFYTSDVDVDKYKIFNESGSVVEMSIKEFTFKGKELDFNLLRQLSKNPSGSIVLDNNFILRFSKNVDPLFKEIIDTKIPSNITHKVYESILRGDTHCNIKTFMNYFGIESGIPQDYVFVNSTGVSVLDVGTNLGLKSSTSTSEPATQMVISKRNLTTNERAYNGLEVFQNAIQYGKLYGDDKLLITIIAPEDGVIKVIPQPEGIDLILESNSGCIYYIRYSLSEELGRDVLVEDMDFVFATQPITCAKGCNPFSRIHPTLSLTWGIVVIDGIQYSNILPRPTADIIQFSRFIYFKFLSDLYSECNIKLDIIHYSSFALQQLRTIDIVRPVGLVSNSFIEIGEYLKLMNTNNSIFNFKLLNGKETILHTSGVISAYVYQDPMSVVSASSKSGAIREVGYTGRLVLGKNLSSPIVGNELVYGESIPVVTKSTSFYEDIQVEGSDIFAEEDIKDDIEEFLVDFNINIDINDSNAFGV